MKGKFATIVWNKTRSKEVIFHQMACVLPTTKGRCKLCERLSVKRKAKYSVRMEPRGFDHLVCEKCLPLELKLTWQHNMAHRCGPKIYGPNEDIE